MRLDPGRFTRTLSVADVMLLGCVIVWSANVSFVKILLRYWSPFSLASVRMVLALAGFTVVLLLRERSVAVARKDLWRIVAAGIFGIFFNQAFFTFALRNSHASSVALLLAMIPVFVALISAAFSIERLSTWSLIGLPVSLLGVFIIIATEPGAALSFGGIEGNAYALGTAGSWAVYTILLQPLLRVYSVARISFWAVIVGLAGLIGPGIAGVDGARLASAPWWSWLLVAYSALGAIFLTNFLWYLGTHRLGASRGSLYAFLQPFLGVLLAVLILGDPANIIEVLGGAIIIAGIVIARHRRVDDAVLPVDEQLVLEPPIPG